MTLFVFTDLDGTLLGHDDYRYEETLPLITELLANNIQVILATSKTLPEVMDWQKRLGLSGPFMVENGSAVYFPTDYQFGPLKPVDLDLQPTPEGWRYVLGTPINELRDCLAPFMGRLTDFTRCTVAEAMALTDLDEASAKAAQTREFTLPLYIDDHEVEIELMHAAGAQGLQCTRGGRFMHLQGACDKGVALQKICRLTETISQRSVSTIALGDNENDRTMLEAANIAVAVNTAKGHLTGLNANKTIFTKNLAPEGWVEGVGTALAIHNNTRGG